MYSQNNEEEIILNYFAGKPVGTLLDIGANDGVTFSNSMELINREWDGVLVEPNPEAYKKIIADVRIMWKCTAVNAAICEHDGVTLLHCNEPHIQGDVGLLSTTVKDEIKRWGNLEFKPVSVEAMTFKTLCERTGVSKFDFITIDAEGMDYEILKQIDLTAVGCQCLCIEYNGKEPEKYIEYCAAHSLKEIHRNAENLIFAI